MNRCIIAGPRGYLHANILSGALIDLLFNQGCGRNGKYWGQ